VLSEILTFVFFLLIGLEIRQGLSKPKEVLLPGACALAGMVLPALIFISLRTGTNAWAVAMPTDVALAIGALSLLGNRVNPAVRLFLLTLAVADDFFSLVALGIFFPGKLNLASAMYTLGAAAIGFLLPYRKKFIQYLSPIATFVIIPIYIWINLLSHLDFSLSTHKLSITLIISRCIGKALGITFAAWALTRFTKLQLPSQLNIREVAGVGLLAGMGLTVSIVIAKITLTSSSGLNEVRIGLFFAALFSGILGVLWLGVNSRFEG